jgi:hypothetical protein
MGKVQFGLRRHEAVGKFAGKNILENVLEKRCKQM